MYTKQPEGYLDLELADWKDHRMFRMAALDRGHLSFADQAYSPDLAGGVLITNPLDAKFMYGPKMSQGFKSMLNSTHIRALVFSRQVPVRVVADVDQGRETLEMSRVGAKGDYPPLYTARWFPKKYRDGRLHNITVTAQLSKGSEEIKSERQFSLEIDPLDHVPNFGVLQRFLLMSDLPLLLQAGLAVAIGVIVLPMCFFRFVHR